MKQSAHSQSGAVLIVVIVLIAILSATVAYTTKNTLQGGQQIRNERDYLLAYQAAHAALWDAERDLALNPGQALPNAACVRSPGFRSTPADLNNPNASPQFTSNCLAGQCLSANSVWASAGPANSGAPWWPVSKGGQWSATGTASSMSAQCETFTGSIPLGTFTGTPAFKGVARQPDYLIELMRPASTLPDASLGGNYTCQTPAVDCLVFKITARGFGSSLTSEVLLQSMVTLQTGAPLTDPQRIVRRQFREIPGMRTDL
jgi:type IV pilus assembly protein PilX